MTPEQFAEELIHVEKYETSSGRVRWAVVFEPTEKLMLVDPVIDEEHARAIVAGLQNSFSKRLKDFTFQMSQKG